MVLSTRQLFVCSSQNTRLLLARQRIVRRRFATHAKENKTDSSSSPNSLILFGIDWKIPAALGFTCIGLLQWYHLNHPTDQERRLHPSKAIERLPGQKTAFEQKMATARQMESLNLFPYRAASRIWGEIHDKELPKWLRVPVYKAWTAMFDCKLDEMKYPLEHYHNLGEFFSRPLKQNARVWEKDPNQFPSPVDGTVAAIGVVENTQGIPTLEQIKGARYRLDDFLGKLPDFFQSSDKSSQKKLYHCVLYLAPGDYHRIHSPIDWTVSERRHFPGNLYPVNKTAARLIPSLFVENERIALVGQWQHGYFSLTAVGATNVGSIVIDNEPDLHTNTKDQDELIGQCLTKSYEKPVKNSRGDEIAQFKLGSTVVLVFEAPENFEFTVQPGDKLTLGKSIGQFTRN